MKFISISHNCNLGAVGVLQDKLVPFAVEVPRSEIVLRDTEGRHLGRAGETVSQCCPMQISNNVHELLQYPTPFTNHQGLKKNCCCFTLPSKFLTKYLLWQALYL